MKEEQPLDLHEESKKFNTFMQDTGKSIEEIYNRLLIPVIEEVTGYSGNISIEIEIQAKFRAQEDQIIPDVTTIATLVFHDEMPSDTSTDPMAYATEYAKRLLAQKFFEETIAEIAKKED